MNRMWAPWRTKYINTIDRKGKGCIFCAMPKQRQDKKNLILFRSKHCYVIMNLF
ncbi:unnamed protein product, partial [marine sediment metagenome]